MKQPHPRRWHSLAAFWDWLHWLGGEREKQKEHYASTRNWNDEPHVIGLLGEQVYALETGQAINTALNRGGDSGIDFPDGTDVKTVTYWQDPYLKVSPDELRVGRALRYALVVVDEQAKRGALIGVASPAQVRSARLHVWKKVPMHSLHYSEIEPLPEDCCPCCGTWSPSMTDWIEERSATYV